MDHYSRLYRDPKSPLTPLTPLANGGDKVFHFQLGGDNSLDQQINEALRTPSHTPLRASEPSAAKAYSTDFLKLRNVFEKQRPQKKHHQLQQLQGQPQRCRCQGNANRTPKCQHPQQPKKIYLQVPPRSQYAGRQHTPTAHQKARPYRQSSPIQPKVLSPRLATLLTQNDMWKYGGLFQREEIDLDVFKTLTYRDLLSLGIRSAEDIPKILRAVHFAHEHF